MHMHLTIRREAARGQDVTRQSENDSDTGERRRALGQVRNNSNAEAISRDRRNRMRIECNGYVLN